MNKTLVIMGCIVVFLSISAMANAQILSPIAQLEGTIGSDTMAFFVGRTTFSGYFQGYKIDYISSNLLFDEVNTLPLFGTSRFEDMDSVTIFDIETTDIESIEDLLDFDLDDVSQFTNVNIIAEEGPFILGTYQANITTNSNLDYAISSVVNFEFGQGNNIPFLAVITTSQMNIQYLGESALLAQPSYNGNIKVEDSNGNLLWNENSTNKIFYVEDEDLSFIQDSPLYLFPLTETSENIELSVAPADTYTVDIYSLVDEVENAAQGLAEIPDISDEIQGFDEVISVASSIVNGGMVLVETDDTFTIDNSHQKFTGFGFARGKAFQAIISPRMQTTTINGDYKLIFLGDHLYTTQAKESKNGVAFPFPLVIVWAIAIGLFLMFHFYIKKDAKELDEKVKRYALIFHIVALIVAFILMDREISYQFGISAIDAIFGQGISLVLAVFVIIELVMWILGYLLLAFPVHLITMSGLKMIGIGKDGKGIGKGVGAFFIWIFCAFYVKLIVNLIFLVINPGNIFQMG
ncbi:MAG: hypothetical protein JSW60_02235 [Thermoplasmatales archaeon]|nr:MAG: hypothetical protein JSW60_02235 [Thermoplasmatales archaeon]